MSNYQELALYKADDLTSSTTSSNWSLYTKPSGTFDATETSMYAEIISLASTTNYGGASLGNQTERYLVAIATHEDTSGSIVYDAQTSAKYNSHMSNGRSLNDIFTSESVYTFTPNHTSFSALQTDLEDDGKHFISSVYSTGGTDYNVFYLIVDKNNLTGGSGPSGGTTVDGYSWDTAYTADSTKYGTWDFTDPDFPSSISKVNKPTDRIDRVYKDLTTNDYFSSKDSQITAFLLQQLFIDQGRTVIDKLKKFGEVNNNDHYTNI